MEPVYFENIPEHSKRKIIATHVLRRVKEKTAQKEASIKTRIAARGDQLDPTIYPNSSSSTVNKSSIKCSLIVAAAEDLDFSVTDIPTAYLHAHLPQTMEFIYTKFNKKNSDTLIKLKPEWAKFMHTDGCLYVKLLKAHYGLAMAGMLWYKELVSKLAIIEYHPTKNDICVFNNRNNKGQLNVHVDDLLISGIDNVLRHIILFLQSLYPTLKAQFLKDGPV